MLPRLEAEEQLRLIEGLLATGGRGLKDGDQRSVMNRLERVAAGNQRPKAPKFTADFLRRAGAQINDPDQPEDRSGLLGPDGEPIGKEVKT